MTYFEYRRENLAAVESFYSFIYSTELFLFFSCLLYRNASRKKLSFIKYTVLSKPHLAYAQKRKDNHKKTQCCFLLERNLLFLQHKRRLKEISCSVDADVKSGDLYPIRFLLPIYTPSDCCAPHRWSRGPWAMF